MITACSQKCENADRGVLAAIAGGGAFRIEDRNSEIKLRALADFALHPNAAAVGLDEMFGNGQAESGAADLAGTSDIHTIETFKNARLIGLGNTDAGVRDGEFDFAGVRRGAEHDLAAGRGVLDRIVEQILQNFGETPAVRRDIRQPVLQIHGNAKVFFGGGTLSGFNAAFHKMRDAQALNLELKPVRIHFGKPEQIVGKAGKPARMLENDLQKADAILRVVNGTGKERFREALDGGEGSLQFVGDIGDEIATDAFELAQFGDVVQNDDGAGGLRGGDGSDGDGEESLAQRAGDDLGFDARLSLQDLAHRFEQFRLSYDLHKSASRLRGHVEIQDFLKPWIGEEQTFRGVHDRDAFHHAAENRRREIALFGERTDGEVEPRGRLIQGHGQSFQGVAGAVCINSTKIAFRNAARKRSQTVYAVRERARDQQRG